MSDVIFEDAVISSTRLRAGFWDCLKLALGWELDVTIEVETEHKPGKVSGKPARILLIAPRWLPKRKPKYYGEEDTAPEPGETHEQRDRQPRQL